MIIGSEGEDYSDLLGDGEPSKVNESAIKDGNPMVSAATTEVAKDIAPSRNDAATITSDTSQTAFISPRAKKLAKKEAVDSNQLSGSGPLGRIIERDVETALSNRFKMIP